MTVEPGDQPEDGLRQAIPAAFGIDEIGMQETLEAGREFQFEIPTENARLAGGEDWSVLLKDAPVPPGGVAAAFATDWRLTKTCAGLGAMSDDAAAALFTAADLRTLATRYADPLARHGGIFTLSGGAVALPGGAESAPVWQKLAGENPRNPGAFFRALLDKPFGTLAAFYSVLARSDAAHQRFFTKTSARAERFYAWYRQGDEFRNGQARQVEDWRTDLLQKVPLDMRRRQRPISRRQSRVDHLIRTGRRSLAGSGHAGDAGSHRRTGAETRTAARPGFGEAPGAALLRVEFPVPLFRASDGAKPGRFRSAGALRGHRERVPGRHAECGAGRMECAGGIDFARGARPARSAKRREPRRSGAFART